MTPDEHAHLGEYLDPEVLAALAGGLPVERHLITVDHLRRPADHLSVVGVGNGSAYVVTSANPLETAEALRAIADELLVQEGQ